MKGSDKINDEEKRAERIIRIYNMTRYILMAILVTLLCIGLSRVSQ